MSRILDLITQTLSKLYSEKTCYQYTFIGSYTFIGMFICIYILILCIVLIIIFYIYNDGNIAK